MKLWFSVRRIPTIAVVLAAMLGATGIAGDVGMSVPNLYGGPNLAVPVALLAPLLLTIALGYGLASGETHLDAVACRPLAVFDTLLVVIFGVFSSSAILAMDYFAAVGLGDATARNTLGYLGLLLLGRSVTGASSASMLPVAVAFVSMLFGVTATRDIRIWAWPIASGDDAVSWGLAITCLTAGVLLSLVRPPSVK